jgi:hypothetical protein
MITAQYIADHVALLKMSKSTVAKPSVTIIEELQAMVTDQNTVLQAQQSEINIKDARLAEYKERTRVAEMEHNRSSAALAATLPTPNQLPPPVVTPAPTPVPAPSVPPVPPPTPAVAYSAMIERQRCAAIAMGRIEAAFTIQEWDAMTKGEAVENVRVRIGQAILAQPAPL